MTPYQHYQLLLRYERSLNLKSVIAETVGPGQRVLDAGCGLGLLSLWAARQGADVLAVDLGDLQLARQLAVDNGVADRIEFRQANLRDLLRAGADSRDTFDVVIAMVYWNDPRRDEAQTRLAGELRRSCLRSGGRMIPNRVQYSAAPIEWPGQDWITRCADVAHGVDSLSRRYDLRFDALARHLSTTCFKEDFPPRLPNGRLERPDCRMLAPFQPQIAIDYLADSIDYPSQIELGIRGGGNLNGVLWSQQLSYDERVIFGNESISWVGNPAAVSSGDRCQLALDDSWRTDNVLSMRVDRP